MSTMKSAIPCGTLHSKGAYVTPHAPAAAVFDVDVFTSSCCSRDVCKCCKCATRSFTLDNNNRCEDDKQLLRCNLKPHSGTLNA
mmetsp:Transcript_17411/g.25938  ORF Transcript_17411/g.25938 Transcript_17411/m.25938 type:complete len:84 (-) Transcript_17411:38-289(-)